MKILARLGFMALALWMTVLGATIYVYAQQGRDTGSAFGDSHFAFGGAGGPTHRASDVSHSPPWFASPGIRKQLKLDDDQFERLNQSYQQYRDRYFRDLSKPAGDLTPEQREALQQELYGRHSNEFNKSRNEILADPSLLLRFNQLQLQYQEFGAFNDPQVRQRLSLTNEQWQKLRRYDNEARQELAKIHRENGKDREAMAKRFSDWQNAARKRINDTLTPQQRETWNTLIGTLHEFNANDYVN